jgi:hypothetical protein
MLELDIQAAPFADRTGPNGYLGNAARMFYSLSQLVVHQRPCTTKNPLQHFPARVQCLTSHSTPSPPPPAPQQNRANQPRRNSDSTDNRRANKPLLGDLVVDETLEASGLQVRGLQLEQQLVVSAGLCVVAELVVAEGEVVEAFAAAFARRAEDVGQEAHAFLLVGAVCGFDQALEPQLASGAFEYATGRRRCRRTQA